MNELAIVEKTDQIGEYRKPDGTFTVGNPGGPGRPAETAETRIVKKAIRQIIEEFKDKLGEALPHITPVLVGKAIEGDLGSIKEVNDRLMGKPSQTVDVTSGGERLSVLSKEEKDKIEALFNANQQGITQVSN